MENCKECADLVHKALNTVCALSTSLGLENAPESLRPEKLATMAIKELRNIERRMRCQTMLDLQEQERECPPLKSAL